MRNVQKLRPGLTVTLATLFIGLGLGLVLTLHDEPVESPLQAAGPPSCLGYTVDDPCITPRSLAQCRAAVAQCGNEPVQVILTCPLQFACGR